MKSALPTRPAEDPDATLVDTDTAWEQWGQRDPYFGVLTDERFRASRITDELKEEFFASGRQHVDHVLETLRRHGDPAFAPKRVLDFGCGVGRLVIAFARDADMVVGMDVSPSMLEEAKANCRLRNITNVTLVGSDDTLSAADGPFDLVHSCIVLQHIEVKRGTALFAQLVRKIRPGGHGAIHVTFGWTAHADTWGQEPPPPPPPSPSHMQTAKRWVRERIGPPPKPADLEPSGPKDPEMQMNYYNLSALMFILHSAGVQKTYMEFTDHGGALGAFIFFRMAG